MMKLLQAILPYGHLIFGFAFLAPLAAEIISRAEIATPLDPIWMGLIIGGGWGLIAQVSGFWLPLGREKKDDA